MTITRRARTALWIAAALVAGSLALTACGNINSDSTSAHPHPRPSGGSFSEQFALLFRDYLRVHDQARVE
jgi:hypothetical protein